MRLRRLRSLVATTLALSASVTTQASAQPAAPPDAQVGGAGESCRARADCASGLKCIDNTCRDAAAGDDPDQPPFEGIRGVVGATLAGGPNLLLIETILGSGTTTAGGLLFALKGGVLIDRLELGVELAPATQVIDFDFDPAFQVNGYVGYHIPITDNFSWPIRGGLGMAAIVSGGSPLFEGRVDLIGVSAVFGPVLLDVHVPSFRIMTEFENLHVFSFMFGVGGAWLPG